MELRQVQEQRVVPQLIQKPALRLSDTILKRYIELLKVLRGVEYNLIAPDCPSCHQPLPLWDIVRSLRLEGEVVTTRCSQPGCTPYIPVTLTYQGSSQRQPTCIPLHVLPEHYEVLVGYALCPPADIAEKETALWHSMIFYHGGLKAAFRSQGFRYRETDVPGDWPERVQSQFFLGALSDTALASCCDTTVDKIRLLRNAAGISPFCA